MENFTVESIIKYIIDNYMYDILCDDNEVPNISFDFKEEEAKKVINKIILENIENNINQKNTIYNCINFVDYNNPIVEVHDYRLFFVSLFEIISAIHDEYNAKCWFKNSDRLYFNMILRYIWLRMTPEDFKNPEDFLIKNIEMIRNDIFDEYLNEDRYMFSIDDDNQIWFRNRFSSSFDEENKEMMFYVKNKDNDIYNLPVVRYGIYHSDNKLVCEIGSIQNKTTNHIKNKIVDNCRKELNRGVPGVLKKNVEPKKLLSLILFIKLLQENNINEISVPSMYVLDYDFHRILEKSINDVFYSKWSDYLINLYKEEYEMELNKHLSIINKVDIICENKSTNFIRLFERLMFHLPDIKILEYPDEISNYMKLSIPSNDITNDVIRKLKKS